MIILGVDPGPKESAYVVYDTETARILSHDYLPNLDLRRRAFHKDYADLTWDVLVVEWIEGYGMSVGKETFDTCFWVGRFCEACQDEFHLIGRKAIKSHLCNSTNAKDRDIRAALIDRFGEPGTKKSPGPTYGIVGHEWSALAVAITYEEAWPAGGYAESDVTCKT